MNEASIIQSNPTELTKKEYQQILDYTTTYNNIFVRFYMSDIVLYIDSELEELDAMLTTSSNKRAIEEVDEMSVDTFRTEAFKISSKKAGKTTCPQR